MNSHIKDIELYREFLTVKKIPFTSLDPLAADCSSRSYVRVFGPHQSWILMDARLEQDSLVNFKKIQTLLVAAGIRVPRIIADGEMSGFLLLEDFGDTTYRSLLLAGIKRSELLKTPLMVLAHLHRQPVSQTTLKTLGASELVDSLNLFWQWGLPFLGKTLAPQERKIAHDLWRQHFTFFDSISPEHTVLCLRDYHSENLMQLPGKGIQSCGVLDFQDAVLCHPAYDVVSLLEDVRLPPDEEAICHLKDFFLSTTDKALNTFDAAYARLALQQSTRIFGLFTYLIQVKERKPLDPYRKTCLYFLKRSLQHPENAPIAQWFNSILPQLHEFQL